MSQTETKGVPHKILVRNKNPGTISTGANTIIELDGKPLKLCKFFKYEVKPGGLAKVTLEFYADVEVQAEVELIQKEVDGAIVLIHGKQYVLNRLEPAIVCPTQPKSDSGIVDSSHNSVD